MKAFFTKFKKSIFVSVLVAAVLGVGYFDTYPTYVKSTGTLTEKQCYEVATLVVVQLLKDKGVPVPEAAKPILADVSRISKRVANYILEKNPDLGQYPTEFVYARLAEACIMGGGEFDLKAK